MANYLLSVRMARSSVSFQVRGPSQLRLEEERGSIFCCDAFIVVYIGHMVKSTVKDPLHAFAFWVYGARPHIFNQCLFSVIITHSLPRWAYAGKFIFSGPSSTGWITCLYHAQQP